MCRRRKNYRKLQSAILALQCATRVRIASKIRKGLMGEQKDIGKLKENNEKLKMEMQSLKAMLAAQAKEDASAVAHARDLDVKEKQIAELEKRVAELEKQLASEKLVIEKLEAELVKQKQQMAEAPSSPRGHRKRQSGNPSPAYTSSSSLEVVGEMGQHVQMPSFSSNHVSPEVLAQHRANVSRLEEELAAERKHRREADGEIIKLRAEISGVELNDNEVDALLAQKLEAPAPTPAPKPKPQRYVKSTRYSAMLFRVLRGSELVAMFCV
jgi:myosin heavy subunit